MGSCTTRHFLLSICLLQLVSTYITRNECSCLVMLAFDYMVYLRSQLIIIVVVVTLSLHWPPKTNTTSMRMNWLCRNGQNTHTAYHVHESVSVLKNCLLVRTIPSKPIRSTSRILYFSFPLRHPHGMHVSFFLWIFRHRLNHLPNSNPLLISISQFTFDSRHLCLVVCNWSETVQTQPFHQSPYIIRFQENWNWNVRAREMCTMLKYTEIKCKQFGFEFRFVSSLHSFARFHFHSFCGPCNASVNDCINIE